MDSQKTPLCSVVLIKLPQVIKDLSPKDQNMPKVHPNIILFPLTTPFVYPHAKCTPIYSPNINLNLLEFTYECTTLLKLWLWPYRQIKRCHRILFIALFMPLNQSVKQLQDGIAWWKLTHIQFVRLKWKDTVCLPIFFLTFSTFCWNKLYIIGCLNVIYNIVATWAVGGDTENNGYINLWIIFFLFVP